MDPVKEMPIRLADALQGVKLDRHKKELSAAEHTVESLAALVTDLTTHFCHQSSPPASQSSIDPRSTISLLCGWAHWMGLTHCEVVFPFSHPLTMMIMSRSPVLFLCCQGKQAIGERPSGNQRLCAVSSSPCLRRRWLRCLTDLFTGVRLPVCSWCCTWGDAPLQTTP